MNSCQARPDMDRNWQFRQMQLPRYYRDSIRVPAAAIARAATAARTCRRGRARPTSGVRTSPQQHVGAAGAPGHQAGVGPVDRQLRDGRRTRPHPRQRATAVVTSTAKTSASGPASALPSYVAPIGRLHPRSFRQAPPNRSVRIRAGSWPAAMSSVGRRLDEAGGPADVAGRLEVGRPAVRGQVVGAQPAGRAGIAVGRGPRVHPGDVESAVLARPGGAARRRRSRSSGVRTE